MRSSRSIHMQLYMSVFVDHRDRKRESLPHSVYTIQKSTHPSLPMCTDPNIHGSASDMCRTYDLPCLQVYIPSIHTPPKRPIGMRWYMSVGAYLRMYRRTQNQSLLCCTQSPLHHRCSTHPTDIDHHMYGSAHHNPTDMAQSQYHLHYRSPHRDTPATLPTGNQLHNNDA